MQNDEKPSNIASNRATLSFDPSNPPLVRDAECPDKPLLGTRDSYPDRWHAPEFLQLDDYQRRALSTALYPRTHPNDGINYTTISLFGELGEFANKLKKCLRGDHGPNWRTDPVILASLHKELQGALWYFAAAADELNFSLSSIADANLLNLADRAQRGTIQGSGDNR